MGRRSTAKERAIRARNRANARKSTGPKTAAGKRRTARNARRHGLWSKTAGPTDEADVAARAAVLAERFAPRDAVEAALVETLARALHRLDLADRLEARLFAREGEGTAAGALLVEDPRVLAEFAALDRFRSRARRELDRSLVDLEQRRRDRARRGAGVGGTDPDPAFLLAAQGLVKE